MHFLILSGANERAIVAACRNLLTEGVGFSIIARPIKDPIIGSFLAPYIVAERTSDALDIEDLITTLDRVRHQLPSRLIYLPASEALNRLVLAHRGRLETEAGLEIPLPSPEIYQTLSDKASFNALAYRFGLETPPREENPATAALPIVAKPYAEFSPSSGQKLYPVLIFEEAQREVFLKRPSAGDYFFQRYVNGQSYYYLFFFDGHGGAVSLFQENIAQQPGGKSIVAAQLCACPSQEFLEKLTECINSTGFFGFCMVEAIQVEGKNYLIELNPRLWGPFALAVDAGFQVRWLANPAEMAQPAPAGPLYYAWLSGMLQTWRAKGRLRWYSHLRGKFFRHLPAFIFSDIYLRKINTLRMAARELL